MKVLLNYIKIFQAGVFFFPCMKTVTPQQWMVILDDPTDKSLIINKIYYDRLHDVDLQFDTGWQIEKKKQLHSCCKKKSLYVEKTIFFLYVHLNIFGTKIWYLSTEWANLITDLVSCFTFQVWTLLKIMLQYHSIDIKCHYRTTAHVKQSCYTTKY